MICAASNRSIRPSAATALSMNSSVPAATALASTNIAARPTSGQVAAAGVARGERPARAIQAPPMPAAIATVSVGANQLVSSFIRKASTAVQKTHGSRASTGTATAAATSSRRIQPGRLRAAAAVNAADQSRQAATTARYKEKWPIKAPARGQPTHGGRSPDLP